MRAALKALLIAPSPLNKSTFHSSWAKTKNGITIVQHMGLHGASIFTYSQIQMSLPMVYWQIHLRLEHGDCWPLVFAPRHSRCNANSVTMNEEGYVRLFFGDVKATHTTWWTDHYLSYCSHTTTPVVLPGKEGAAKLWHSTTKETTGSWWCGQVGQDPKGLRLFCDIWNLRDKEGDFHHYIRGFNSAHFHLCATNPLKAQHQNVCSVCTNIWDFDIASWRFRPIATKVDNLCLLIRILIMISGPLPLMPASHGP